MQRLIETCIRRPVGVLMTLGALLLGALRAASLLPLEKLPEISVPRVAVECAYPGLGAVDIRSVIALPVEDALSSVRGLERMRSISRDGSAVVVLDFAWGTDPAAAAVLVRQAIDAVYGRMPEGAEKPLVLPGESDAMPVAVVALRSRAGDSAAARSMGEYELRSRFRRLEGIGAVVLSGGTETEAVIRVDGERAFSRGLGPLEFARTIASEWVNIPAGSAREGDMELVVVAAGRPETTAELPRAVLPWSSGPLYPGEVADIGLGPAKRKSIFVSGGKAGVSLELYRRSGADPAALSRRIRKALQEAEDAFSRDFEFELLYDGSTEIRKGIGDLGRSALLAASAVVLTLAFFLRSLKGSLLAALSIPISAAAALCALALGGKSLNSMSLGGLALGIGLVSDTSVVVLDLLVRRYSHADARPEPSAMGAVVSSLSASSFGGTATTAVVFIPVLFLPGPLGALYGDLSVALVSSITAGWLYAQFALPCLYRLTLSPPPGITHRRSANRLSLSARYRRLLRGVLREPLPIFAVALLSTAAGVYCLLSAPVRFMPPDGATELEASIDFPPGTDLDRVEAQGLRMSAAAESVPGVAAAFGRAGAEDEDTLRRGDIAYARERLTLRCLLAPGADPEHVRAGLQDALKNAAVRFPQDRVERLLGLSSAHTMVALAPDRGEAEHRWDRAMGEIKRRGGETLATFARYPSGDRPELRLRPKRDMASGAGITMTMMAESLRSATEGVPAVRLEPSGRPLEVRVSGSLPPSAGGMESRLRAFPLRPGSESPVFLGTVATVERGSAPAAVSRLDRADAVYLEGRPLPGMDRPLAALLAEVEASVTGLRRADESVFRRYGVSLAATLALVVLLLYLTLGAQFESFSLPIVLMAGIPFSLAGAGPAVRLAGGGLDSGSVLGLVVLFGLAVNNGIVLYEICRDKIAAGDSPLHAVYSGASERLRPILATTGTTVFALLPVVFSPLGAGQRSMAAAMLGGVAASTALTLLALPPIFARTLGRRRE